MKKAQLAVETLLIYGIAILIVMLAVGALISFGVLDLGGLLPDQCQISGGLSCENYLVTTNQVQLELMNNLGKNIDNIDILVKGEGNNEGLWNCEPTTYGTLVQGALSDPITLSCDIAVPQGKKITGTILANVSLAGSQIPRAVSGRIRATVS